MPTKATLLAALTLSLVAGPLFAATPPALRTGPEVDASYRPAVAIPAYDGEIPRPVVAIDEGHKNAFTLTGRFRPFADLLTRDGYMVKAHRGPFSAGRLAEINVLVVAEPSAAPTAAECDAVRDWVRGGGALLLTAGPNTTASGKVAAAGLAKALGVEMSSGHVFDPQHPADATTTPTAWIRYSKANKFLADHPITQGRNASEALTSILVFQGQALRGPAGSATFLPLPASARDADEWGEEVSAAGAAQGIAFELGKGRVVVLADPAMVTAQQLAGGELKIGMNRPGNDNRQLTLNVLHWLTRLLG